jgi:hypothetical protein
MLGTRRNGRVGDLLWADTVGRAKHPRCPIYTSRSTVPGAGSGVFSKIDLPAGALVTPYDGTLFYGAIVDAKRASRVLDYALDVTPTGRDPSKTKDRRMVLPVMPRTHSEHKSLSGVFKRRPVEVSLSKRYGSGLGHRLNDAIHPDVTGRSNNCAFAFVKDEISPRLPPRAFIRTTSFVPAGGELFVSYHVSYWAWRASSAPKNVSAFCHAMQLAAKFLDRDHELELEDYLNAGEFLVHDRRSGTLRRITLLASEPEPGNLAFEISPASGDPA